VDPALILLLGLAVILVLQFTRISRQRREVRETQLALEVGRKVLTAAGMIGTVVEVAEDTVVLQGEDGHRTRWVRGSVVRVVPDESSAPAPEQPGPASGPDRTPDN
jgi:preprotein translocase subunit YajC